MQITRRRGAGAAALVALLTVLAVASAGTQAASPAGGRFTCTGSAKYGAWSPVSAGPNTYIIGNCAPGTIIRPTYYSNDQNGPFYGGLISGSFAGCGAVQARNLRRVSSTERTSICARSGRRPPASFLTKVDCRSGKLPGNRTRKCRKKKGGWDPDLGGDKTTRVVATCRAYANYRPFSSTPQATDPVQVIAPDNRRTGQVRWRYITKDGRYVMVHDRRGKKSGGAIWVFVSRGCVTTPHATTP